MAAERLDYTEHTVPVTYLLYIITNKSAKVTEATYKTCSVPA